MDEISEERSRHHQAERLSHALYGLIIVTATLGAERAHVTKVAEAFVLLLSTALVLVLAHTYSAWMAERAMEGGRLSVVARRIVIVDNLPVAGAIVFPMFLFSLVGLGVLELQVAYGAAIAVSIGALFGVGVYEGRLASMGWFHSALSGAGAGSIGVIVILIEAFFD